MTNDDSKTSPDPVPSGRADPAQLEKGTYEIIRQRLESHAAELKRRLSSLNEDRRKVFGSIPTKLLSTERITTANNCIPRDMVPVGEQFIFGYNVQFGLKSETLPDDVFAVYEFAGGTFVERTLDMLQDKQFLDDFRQLYKYYKGTRFSRFYAADPYVYFVFQVGKSPNDIKAFKWLRKGSTLEYADNRSEFEVRLPPQHGFQWVRTGRDFHRPGRHPHVSIEDIVFVETIGGDLTIKVEDNTDSGAGIYSEPVDDIDQSLDDAEIFYAIVGNLVLLKIRPFKESTFRHIVFNRKTQTAMRVDSIAQACVLLPESHGLVFANGCYLQTGDYKFFDTEVRNLSFERHIPGSNGEDHLYVFFNPQSGEYELLSYNMIEQQVSAPVFCHGYSFFENGHLVYFRENSEPQKHHALQVWQTPYVGAGFAAAVNHDSMLYKIGNRDIVRGMAECHEVINLIGKDDAYAGLYLDLVKKTTGILDSYFWMSEPVAHQLAETLVLIRESAKSAVEEFEKVVNIRRHTAEQYQKVREATMQAIRDAQHRRFQIIDDFVHSLGELRKVRGQLITLRELKYIDLAAVTHLEKSVTEGMEKLSRNCIEFLAREEALVPYESKVAKHHAEIDSVTTVVASRELDRRFSESASELEMLIEIVSNLKIEDTTRRTAIIDHVSTIYSSINQSRAALRKRTRELMTSEGAAEFASQLKLLSQAVINYLDLCDTSEKCDEYLTRLMVQVEELEGKFAEFDEYVLQLAEKREEIYSTFDARRVQILEGRSRRAAALQSAADRILSGVKSRAGSLQSVDDINSYFASDLMIEKVRGIIDQLSTLDESVKVDELQGRLKAIREEAVRQLRDRQELFVDGQNTIRLGRHQFSVNIQPLDLTTIVHNGELAFHLTGTKFIEPIVDARLLELRDVWDQELESENETVYRAEYLAYLMLRAAEGGHWNRPVSELAIAGDGELLQMTREFMAPRYQEGYVKGVHDHDASLILRQLLMMRSRLGLLQYSPRVRASANLLLERESFQNVAASMLAQVKVLARAQSTFGEWSGRNRIVARLCETIQRLESEHGLSIEVHSSKIAEYLFERSLQTAPPLSRAAHDVVQKFESEIERRGEKEAFFADCRKCGVEDRFELARDWLQVFAKATSVEAAPEVIDEAASVLATDRAVDAWNILEGQATASIEGLLGEHRRLAQTPYVLDFVEFMDRLEHFSSETRGRFESFAKTKHEILERRRTELRLDEFKPRVLTSFVRNQLINDVYLPLIGDNLAKQMGATGAQKRTDLMGLLLLISPPGYGKTTLMEYLANRLGLTFVKVNGPAIGHRVLSLDPAEAPNASAREEIEKLNLALEMGDNVMIYVDDIQHCHSEFLQKFISLCDATRRIEGVFHGRPQTYDLRGRKVCVVMAGNPYTESGEKFQIPDMLANRADTYNLGDVIGEHLRAFELSYLENAFTSNPSLQRMNSGDREDIHAMIEMATNPESTRKTLTGNFTVEEISEIVSVIRKMLRVRDVLLRVNRNYIDSAAQADAYRVEPPFRLQGSYRDMNKLAEKIVPVMNDNELDQRIVEHYVNQAQTLTTGAESNLLKFREILGILSTDQRERWDEIKRGFRRNLLLGAAGEDNVAGQLIGQISTLADGLQEIRQAVDQAIQAWKTHDAVEERGSATALEQLTLSQMGQGVNELARLNENLVLIKSILEASPERTNKIAHESAPQRIHVVNKVPQAFLEIIRYQFEVLQQWLDPLNKLSETLPPAKGISQKAKKIAKQYRHIVRELEQSEPPESDES